MAWAAPFLILIGLVLPILAVQQTRQAKTDPLTDEELPSLKAFALQTIVMQGVIFGLAWLAWAVSGVQIAWTSSMGGPAIGAAFAIVLLGLTVAWADSRRPPDPHNVIGRVLVRSSPFDPAWLSLALVAGVVEEFAYRGVLTGILAQFMPPGAAWILSAVLFAFGHFSQGWRGFVGSLAFALALQGVVHLSGGLLLAILAHIAYDLGAVWLGRRLEERRKAVSGDSIGSN